MHVFHPLRAALATALFGYLLAGCATDEAVEPANAKFDFHIKAAVGTDRIVTRAEGDSLVWRIDTALATVGEIGIHWGRLLTKAAHDVPGAKPSPKIYDYFVVDFLRTQALQTLTVDPAVYDHIHMILRPALPSTHGADTFPEAVGHSLYFSGTVTRNDTVMPFRVEIDSTYKENDLGDVTFTLEVHKDTWYNLYLSPKLDTWFTDILGTELKKTSGDTVVIRLDNANRPAAVKLETRYALDNAFLMTVEPHVP